MRMERDSSFAALADRVLLDQTLNKGGIGKAKTHSLTLVWSSRVPSRRTGSSKPNFPNSSLSPYKKPIQGNTGYTTVNIGIPGAFVTISTLILMASSLLGVRTSALSSLELEREPNLIIDSEA